MSATVCTIVAAAATVATIRLITVTVSARFELSEPGMNLVALHPIQGHSMLAWDTKPKMFWGSIREFGFQFFL
jgi:hypothetical protein